MPKVSVIIPVYGVEKYIERCARSLFDQTLDDIEFIFVDDCTPDRSIEILKSVIEKFRLRFAEKNYVVRIERMPTNSGLPAVRRHGMEFATGEYIVHCDSDDWVDIDMYRQMYELAKAEHADMVSCDYMYHDGYHVLRTMTERVATDRNTAITDLMFHKTHWVLWNRMFKRSILNNPITFPTNNMGEDMALVLQLMYYARCIRHVSQPLYYYFYNPSSITNEASEKAALKRFKQVYMNLKIVLDFYQSKSEYQLFRKPLQYLKLFVKQQIPLSSSEGRKLWSKTFPMLEFNCLFGRYVSCEQKIMLLRQIFRQYVKYLKKN